MHYDSTTLPNGLRIVSEEMPAVASVAIGCWVDTGSRDERPEEAGVSHFLEHLLFKGSDRWPARRISEAFDAVGARHNAFTSKEYTCFWARLRDEDLPLGVEILAEMLRRPAFRPDEIDAERSVVLEEINMNDDDPTDVAHERFIEALWEGHPLAPPVLGTRGSIEAMTREIIDGYWARRYAPSSVVVAAAGRIPHDRLVELVERWFGDWEGDAGGRRLQPPAVEPRVRLERRDTEQAHLVFGSPAIPRDDERRFAHLVVDHVLGGGMSSRLFREIREERGLAYAVHSFRLPFAEAGASGIYVGTTPSRAAEVLKLVRAELDKLLASGLDDDELERAKGHMKGALALALEDANSRMNRLGRNELTGLPHLSVDEIVARVDAVDAEAVRDVVAASYGGPYVLGAVGPLDEEQLEGFVR